MPALRTRDTPLEVTTDASPHPPALSIIAPTPRAFTFPSSHNLNDSPYSTPSNSPEPDLYPSFTTCTTPQSTFTRTLSPELSPQESEPSPTSTTQHKRRKSSSSDAERRPKKGDEDYIKRPENAFILFRRACVEERQAAQAPESTDGKTKKPRQADLSKNISQMWKSLTPAERQHWEDLAKEKKKEHEQLYPNYVYRPQRSKKERKNSKKGKHSAEDSLESPDGSEMVSITLPVASSRQHGRSASAPTPPPYQSFSIPNVYTGGSPSCPTSPSLLPMISRHATHNGCPEESFDYMPPGSSLMPPPSFAPGTFENSPFIRTMFSQPADTSSLPPLSMPSDNGLHPGQAFSPGSSVGSSSGPSSPNSGPYTPTTTMLAHSFAQLNAGLDSTACSNGIMTQEQLQESIQMEMYQQQHDLDLAHYAWNTNAIWPDNSEMLLAEDFDISSIPPIEIGVPKFGEELRIGFPPEQTEYQSSSDSYSQGSSQDPQQQIPPLLGFDDMMAGKGF